MQLEVEDSVIGRYYSNVRQLGSREPLLTAAQERVLAVKVQKALSLEQCRKALAAEMRRSPTSQEIADHLNLSEEEVEAILKDGLYARNKMVRCNLRLVVSIAKRYVRRQGSSQVQLSLEDLIEEGNIGLLRAVEKFDPSKGYRFSTYAYHWIRQACQRYLMAYQSSVRIPYYLQDRLREIRKAWQTHTARHKQPPTLADLARATNLDSEQILDLLRRAQKVVSLNALVGDGNEEFLDFLPSKSQDPLDNLFKQHLREELKSFLSISLSPRHAKVVFLRYGLETEQPLSLERISHELGTSKSEVSSLLKVAMTKLRKKALASDRLQELWSQFDQNYAKLEN